MDETNILTNTMDNFEKLIKSCDENFEFYTKKLTDIRVTLQIYDKFIIDFEAESNEMINLKRSISFSSYLIIPFLELSVTLKNLILAKTNWEKIFFIKNSYLTIFETLKVIRPEKNSTTILEENIKSHNLKELKLDLEKCNAKVTIFRNNENYQLIENVRHYAAGHINPKFKVYYDTIFKLDGEIGGLIIKDFMEIISEFLVLSQKVEGELLKIYEKRVDNSKKELFEAVKKLDDIIKSVG